MKRAPLARPGRHPAPVQTLTDLRLRDVRGGDATAMVRPATTASDDWESPNQS